MEEVQTMSRSRMLMTACQSGDIETAKRLLSEKPQWVATTDKAGLQPIHYAAQGGHLEMVSFLLAAGARAEALTIDGKNAMDFALINNHMNVANALWVEAGGSLH